MDFVMRRPLMSAAIALIALFLVISAFPIVPETKQAVVVRFGKPVRILNRFEAGRPIGGAERASQDGVHAQHVEISVADVDVGDGRWLVVNGGRPTVDGQRS